MNVPCTRMRKIKPHEIILITSRFLAMEERKGTTIEGKNYQFVGE